jgi:hypothetical protein
MSLLVALAWAAPSRSWADEAPAFYRGINLNGPALTIDGHQWESGDPADFRCNGNAFENQEVALKPKTDPERTRMIRSSRWGRDCNVELLNVPPGRYQVFLYLWEDNDPCDFSILVNGNTVLPKFNSGHGGDWKRLGPWPLNVQNGTITVSARGGDANFSGVEVWRGAGQVPDPFAAEFAPPPTGDQLAFFESKVRPVLVNHCYECHSQDSDDLGGGLLLDSRAGVIKGGDTGRAIQPGDPDSSLLIAAIRHTNPDLSMPPESKLSDIEIADLEEWVRMRSPDPRTEDTVAKLKAKSAIDWDKARDFWSLKPIKKPSIPATHDNVWPSGDIDRLLLSKIESAGLTPTADADRATWIRRATYDLIGLPPTPEEIDAFVNDKNGDAYAKVVDRLLQSPRYGERWGRHWLDVVRYADTAGDNSDFPIPQMHKYRDWVIEAFNNDMPYDEFVRDQIAGDLVSGGSIEEQHKRLIATGYIANARRFGSRVDDYPTHLTIEDTIDNLGRTFLATTINCARCHNHKFDPIPQDDYYAIYGFFQSTRYPWPGIELEQKQRDLVPLAPAEEVARVTAERKSQQETLDREVQSLEKQRDAANGDEKKNLEKAVEEARKKAQSFSKSPLPYELAYAVADGKADDAALQQKGDPLKPGAVIHRRFLSVLNGNPLPDGDSTSGRLQLANWITDRDNPLTARVIVNRIWLYHFGKGLVPTANDFGRQGKPPTNPELLDWLASTFVESGWSIKSLHRAIMLSHAYRTSGDRTEQAREQDPNNDLLAGFPRLRLDAEELRDTLLQLSGNLDLTPAGAHPFPPQTDWGFTQHNPFKAIYETNHRSVFLMTQRIQRHPYLGVFDGADPSISTPRRMNSTTPLQALYLLNDEFVHKQAQGFADRLRSQSAENGERITTAYRLAFGRSPVAEETEAGIEFLNQSRDSLKQAGIPEDQLDSQSWQAYIRVLFRLNEFLYVD